MYDRRRGAWSDLAAPSLGLAGAPGKRTRTQFLPRRAAAARGPVGDVADAGVTGAAQPLPHRDAIQRSFGAHDVSGTRAHLDGAAEHACDDLGAQAYATGRDVAFRSPPDLHTAAHEAAHVIQQRAGFQLEHGAGQPGDDHERHADQVADLVVQGKSAESLLDRYGTATTGAAPLAGPVQMKGAKDSVTPLRDEVRSDDVPDLTGERVQEIKDAKDSYEAKERQEVLDNLFDDVKRDLFEQKDWRCIQVNYEHSQQTTLMALTEVVGKKVVVTIYPGSFRHPAILYSVLRHELIHAAQRMMDPDEPTKEEDDFIYGNPQEGEDKILYFLQEIETHVWELNHARETGIDNDGNEDVRSYREVTVSELVGYVNQTAEALTRNNHMTNQEVSNWAGYLRSAWKMLSDCSTKNTGLLQGLVDRGRANLPEAMAKLQAAFTQRNVQLAPLDAPPPGNTNVTITNDTITNEDPIAPTPPVVNMAPPPGSLKRKDGIQPTGSNKKRKINQ